MWDDETNWSSTGRQYGMSLKPVELVIHTVECVDYKPGTGNSYDHQPLRYQWEQLFSTWLCNPENQENQNHILFLTETRKNTNTIEKKGVERGKVELPNQTRILQNCWMTRIEHTAVPQLTKLPIVAQRARSVTLRRRSDLRHFEKQKSERLVLSSHWEPGWL